MIDHGPMVISRYESKYLITEDVASRLRDDIRVACSPDSYAGADGRYTVNNLYFDTPQLRFYYDTRHKRYNRFKPRVRFYGDRPDGFLWLELKHKLQSVTWKTRRRLPLEEWPTLFSNRADDEPRMVTVHDSFENVVLRFGASPVAHVRYIREPYVSDLESYCRVTFDRALTYRRAHGSYELLSNEEFLYYDDVVTTGYPDGESPVLLEIKTESIVPVWVVRLIQKHNLVRCGFSKYCNAIDNSKNLIPLGDRVCSPLRM